MLSVDQTLAALEQACESDEDLFAFSQPNLNEIIEVVKALPADEREIVQDRLNRISTIIEGKMMIYAEELENLGGQIRKVANSNVATSAYRTVAVFPIKAQAGDA